MFFAIFRRKLIAQCRSSARYGLKQSTFARQSTVRRTSSERASNRNRTALVITGLRVYGRWLSWFKTAGRAGCGRRLPSPTSWPSPESKWSSSDRRAPCESGTCARSHPPRTTSSASARTRDCSAGSTSSPESCAYRSVRPHTTIRTGSSYLTLSYLTFGVGGLGRPVHGETIIRIGPLCASPINSR